jgi:hypothetical protein
MMMTKMMIIRQDSFAIHFFAIVIRTSLSATERKLSLLK